MDYCDGCLLFFIKPVLLLRSRSQRSVFAHISRESDVILISEIKLKKKLPCLASLALNLVIR